MAGLLAGVVATSQGSATSAGATEVFALGAGQPPLLRPARAAERSDLRRYKWEQRHMGGKGGGSSWVGRFGELIGTPRRQLGRRYERDHNMDLGTGAL